MAAFAIIQKRGTGVGKLVTQAVFLAVLAQACWADEVNSAVDGNKDSNKINQIDLSSKTIEPSFNCGKAGTPVEHAICDDEELASLDNQLDSLYKAALSRTKNPEELRESQRAWLKTEREKTAVSVQYGGEVSVNGLKRMYQRRIIEMGSFAVTLPDIVGHYINQESAESVRQGPTGYVSLIGGDEGKVEVSLTLYYSHGHICYLDGIGTWEGNAVVVKKEGHSGICALKVISDGKSILLKDADFKCTRMSCGARGSLDNTIIPRASGELIDVERFINSMTPPEKRRKYDADGFGNEH